MLSGSKTLGRDVTIEVDSPTGPLKMDVESKLSVCVTDDALSNSIN